MPRILAIPLTTDIARPTASAGPSTHHFAFPPLLTTLAGAIRGSNVRYVLECVSLIARLLHPIHPPNVRSVLDPTIKLAFMGENRKTSGQIILTKDRIAEGWTGKCNATPTIGALQSAAVVLLSPLLIFCSVKRRSTDSHCCLIGRTTPEFSPVGNLNPI